MTNNWPLSHCWVSGFKSKTAPIPKFRSYFAQKAFSPSSQTVCPMFCKSIVAGKYERARRELLCTKGFHRVRLTNSQILASWCRFSLRCVYF